MFCAVVQQCIIVPLAESSEKCTFLYFLNGAISIIFYFINCVSKVTFYNELDQYHQYHFQLLFCLLIVEVHIPSLVPTNIALF